METNWARIWQDFRITIWFLIIAIATGLLFVLLQGAGTRMIATPQHRERARTQRPQSAQARE